MRPRMCSWVVVLLAVALLPGMSRAQTPGGGVAPGDPGTVSQVPADPPVPDTPPPPAPGTCQWLCIGDECRLDAAPDATCEGDLPEVDVPADPAGDVCLAEPVTLDEVTDVTDTTALSAQDLFRLLAADETPAPKQDVLLTGFGPFPGVTDNPSKRILGGVAAAVKKLCGADLNLDVTTKVLKVELGAIRECKVQNKIVISLGVCPDEQVRVETGAVNCYRSLDGSVKCEVVKDGPPTAKSPGPIPDPLPGPIAGYPVKTGDATSAGDYVCNATYYWTCTQKGCTPYFIHIPPLPSDQTKDKDFTAGLADLICKILAKNKPVAK